LFDARVINPSRNGDLHENHPFLFTADVIGLERRGEFKKEGRKTPIPIYGRLRSLTKSLSGMVFSSWES
jgi:hypothetical protein